MRKITVVSFGHTISITVRKDIEWEFKGCEHKFIQVRFNLDMKQLLGPQVDNQITNLLPEIFTGENDEIIFILPGVTVAGVLLVDSLVRQTGKIPLIAEITRRGNEKGGSWNWRVKQIHHLPGILPAQKMKGEKVSWLRRIVEVLKNW